MNLADEVRSTSQCYRADPASMRRRYRFFHIIGTTKLNVGIQENQLKILKLRNIFIYLKSNPPFKQTKRLIIPALTKINY